MVLNVDAYSGSGSGFGFNSGTKRSRTDPELVDVGPVDAKRAHVDVNTELKSLGKRVRDQLENEAKKRRVCALRPHERAILLGQRGPLEVGHERVKRYRDVVAHVTKSANSALSSAQREITEKILGANARNIYRSNVFEANSVSILRRNGWDASNVVQWVDIVMPRRTGKTRVASINCLAALMTVPSMSILVFSVSLNQSVLLLREVVAMFFDAGYDGQVKFRKSNTTLTLTFGPNDVRTIIARPASINVRSSLCC